MQETFSFRSSFRGFNREDVITYITKVLEESSENVSRISTLETDLMEYKEEIESKTAEIERLKQENEELSTAKKNETYRSSKITDKALEEKYEARLGAAMMDAKRFSDLLIQEANDKCAELFSLASNSADKSSDVALALADEMQKTMNSVTETMSVLFKNLKTISDSLKAFSNETQTKSDEFNFKSEFTSDAPVAAEEPVKSNEMLENMLSDILKLSDDFNK